MIDANAPVWRTVPEKTERTWLQVDDGEGWWKAFVKWDGCLEITRHFNVPGGDGETDSGIHICDLDEFIHRLELLRDMAKRHFGQDWPNQ